MDAKEKECELRLRERFGDQIALLERQISLLAACIDRVRRRRPALEMTLSDLERSTDDKLVCSMVALFVMRTLGCGNGTSRNSRNCRTPCPSRS